MNKFSYDFRDFTRDGLESGTNSINVSSTNTKVDFFSASFIICYIFFFGKISSVGLFGLQIKIIPFVGMFFKNF